MVVAGVVTGVPSGLVMGTPAGVVTGVPAAVVRDPGLVVVGRGRVVAEPEDAVGIAVLGGTVVPG
ncbi:MAG TPA: hypothetical protein VK771_01600 [Acidimicrobiia bacterium]|nr:hypothetical protein [Acidimicrobiia bacterium]